MSGIELYSSSSSGGSVNVWEKASNQAKIRCLNQVYLCNDSNLDKDLQIKAPASDKSRRRSATRLILGRPVSITIKQMSSSRPPQTNITPDQRPAQCREPRMDPLWSGVPTRTCAWSFGNLKMLEWFLETGVKNKTKKNPAWWKGGIPQGAPLLERDAQVDRQQLQMELWEGSSRSSQLRKKPHKIISGNIPDKLYANVSSFTSGFVLCNCRPSCPRQHPQDPRQSDYNECTPAQHKIHVYQYWLYSKKESFILSPDCWQAARMTARRWRVKTSGNGGGTSRDRPYFPRHTWANPSQKQISIVQTFSRLTPCCQWWGKPGCWAAAQQWKLPHNPPWGAARADGISAPLLPILAWRNPRGWYLSLTCLLNALESARGMKSALRGPLCQYRILTIKQCHVEDQPASTFRNSCSSVQVRRNPHLRSEMTMEDSLWSIFHSLHLICDRSVTFCKHSWQDTHRQLAFWILHTACNSVGFDSGSSFPWSKESDCKC